MANSDIIRRMLALVDGHELGSRTSDEVETEIENHMNALEQVGLRDLHASRELAYRLVIADLSEIGDGFEIQEDATQVRAEMRDFLRSLPGAEVAG